MNTQDKIQIMQAFVEGKTVEVKTKPMPESHYMPLSSNPEPMWNWESFDYRIKPEPMEIQVWCKDSNPVCLHRMFDPKPADRYTLKTFVEKV